jgi:endonuclease I
MHALVPSHAALNSARSNRVFAQILDADDALCAEWSTAWSDGRTCETPVATSSGVVGDVGSASIGGFWQPPSNMKGFVARAMLYMALRYDGDDDDTYDLRLAQEAYRDPDARAAKANQTRPDAHYAFGRLSDLLRWHASSAVAEWERARNDAVCAAQGNRNPFVDHPELVTRVFGTVAEAEAGNTETWTTRTGEKSGEDTSAARGFPRRRVLLVAGVLLVAEVLVAAFY